MTTLISLAARDFIAVGCDSLATVSVPLVFPYQLVDEFFDPDGQLKVGADGRPLLSSPRQIHGKAISMPINNLPSVTKLFSLEPYRACLLFSGSSRIGEVTIKNLVETFKSRLPPLTGKRRKKDREPYAMEWLTSELKTFILELYEAEIPNPKARQAMDIIISGYSEQYREPELWRLKCSYDWEKDAFEAVATNQVPRKSYNVIFGGQYDAVQRIVHGIDETSYWSLRTKMIQKLEQCFSELREQVASAAPDLVLTKPDFTTDAYNFFKDGDGGGVNRIFTDVGSLSEQAGIDLVYFLVSIMIQTQAFDSAIPTVGGKIHVAVLTKDTPFRWISDEAYTYEGKPIPKFSRSHA